MSFLSQGKNSKQRFCSLLTGTSIHSHSGRAAVQGWLPRVHLISAAEPLKGLATVTQTAWPPPSAPGFCSCGRRGIFGFKGQPSLTVPLEATAKQDPVVQEESQRQNNLNLSGAFQETSPGTVKRSSYKLGLLAERCARLSADVKTMTKKNGCWRQRKCILKEKVEIIQIIPCNYYWIFSFTL